MVVRFYYLQHHYRSPLDFSFEGLEAAEKAYRKLCAAYGGDYGIIVDEDFADVDASIGKGTSKGLVGGVAGGAGTQFKTSGELGRIGIIQTKAETVALAIVHADRILVIVLLTVGVETQATITVKLEFLNVIANGEFAGGSFGIIFFFVCTDIGSFLAAQDAFFDEGVEERTIGLGFGGDEAEDEDSGERGRAFHHGFHSSSPGGSV